MLHALTIFALSWVPVGALLIHAVLVAAALGR